MGNDPFLVAPGHAFPPWRRIDSDPHEMGNDPFLVAPGHAFPTWRIIGLDWVDMPAWANDTRIRDIAPNDLNQGHSFLSVNTVVGPAVRWGFAVAAPVAFTYLTIIPLVSFYGPTCGPETMGFAPSTDMLVWLLLFVPAALGLLAVEYKCLRYVLLPNLTAIHAIHFQCDTCCYPILWELMRFTLKGLWQSAIQLNLQLSLLAIGKSLPHIGLDWFNVHHPHHHNGHARRSARREDKLSRKKDKQNKKKKEKHRP